MGFMCPFLWFGCFDGQFDLETISTGIRREIKGVDAEYPKYRYLLAACQEGHHQDLGKMGFIKKC